MSTAAAPGGAPKPEKRALAAHEMVLSATLQSTVGIDAWTHFAGATDLAKVADGLADQAKGVYGGDMRRVEAMLYGQAMTLQTIFTSLSRTAADQKELTKLQVTLTLALKAQAQCRATLEALSEIKNPRAVAFVKQANIAQQQQVNNGAADGPGGAVRQVAASRLATDRKALSSQTATFPASAHAAAPLARAEADAL